MLTSNQLSTPSKGVGAPAPQRGVGAPAPLLNLIQDLYTQTNSQVRLGSHLSPSFQTKSGVRQGCALAPALFCRAIDWIMDRAMPNRGVTISGDHISDVDYADDITAVEGDLAHITRTLERPPALNWAYTSLGRKQRSKI